MAAGETPTLLSAARHARRKECGRLDRGHSGVLARVQSGRWLKFVEVLACAKYGFGSFCRSNSRISHTGSGLAQMPAERCENCGLGIEARSSDLL